MHECVMNVTADGTHSDHCAQRGYLHVCSSRFALISPAVIIIFCGVK